MIDESFDDDVGVLDEFAVGLVFIVEKGSPVDKTFGVWERSHFEDVGGEEVEFFGGDELVLHGLLDA